MAPKTMKADPVTGADLRNSVLANCSENSPSLLTLQVARLTRRCGVTASMAEVLAPMIFAVLS